MANPTYNIYNGKAIAPPEGGALYGKPTKLSLSPIEITLGIKAHVTGQPQFLGQT